MATDADLIRQCAQGDAAAARTLVERYEPRLRPFLMRMVGDREDAEDALCDAFLRMWRSAPRYRGECEVSTWIYRIAVTAATDALRRRRAGSRLVPLEEHLMAAAPRACEPEHLLLMNEHQARCGALVRAALATLTPAEQITVTLHYLEDLSYVDVAAVTGVPLTTVRMRLFHARRRMQSRLRQLLEDDEIHELAKERRQPARTPSRAQESGL
jgi:RNA polymerase sigma-70 factor (ECF subfamily)